MKSTRYYRDEIATKKERMKAITDKAKVNKRSFYDSESNELAELEREIMKLEGKLEIAEEREGVISRKHESGGGTVHFRKEGHGSTTTIDRNRYGIPGISRSQEENDLGILARAAYDQKFAEKRGINSSSGSATIQDPSIASEVAMQLSSRFLIGDTGISIIAPDNYTQWPVVTAGPAAQWFAEGDTISADAAMTIGSKKIDYSYVAFLVKASQMWLRDSAVDGDRVINLAIMRALDEALMTAILSGNSSNKQPDGFDNISGIQTVDAGSAVLSDYSKRISAVQKLLAADVDIENISHIYGTTSWGQTQGFADTTGQPLMPPKGLDKIRSVHSNAVLENYGVGTDETREYFFDRTNVRVALGARWEITMIEKYAETMEVGFLVVAPVDIKIFHPSTLCIIENVATS